MSTQTNRMVNVAMVTVAAAETEEAIGVGSGSGEDSERCSHDPDLMVRALFSLTNENSILRLSLSLSLCRSKSGTFV